jgi:hypothetical protein
MPPTLWSSATRDRIGRAVFRTSQAAAMPSLPFLVSGTE